MSSDREKIKKAQKLVKTQDALRERKYERAVGLERIGRAREGVSDTFAEALKKAQTFSSENGKKNDSKTTGKTSGQQNKTLNTESGRRSGLSDLKFRDIRSIIGAPPSYEQALRDLADQSSWNKPTASFNPVEYLNRYITHLMQQNAYDTTLRFDVENGQPSFNGATVDVSGNSDDRMVLRVLNPGTGTSDLLFNFNEGLQNFVMSTNVEWLNTALESEIIETIESYLTLLLVSGISEVDINDAYRQTPKYKALKTYHEQYADRSIEGNPVDKISDTTKPMSIQALTRAARRVDLVEEDTDDPGSGREADDDTDDDTDDDDTDDDDTDDNTGVSGAGYNTPLRGLQSSNTPSATTIQVPTVSHRGIAVDSNGKLGSIRVDLSKLNRKNVLHVVKESNPTNVKLHEEVSQKTAKDLNDLLTKRRLTNRKYTEKSLSLFNRIKQMSKMDLNGIHSKKLTLNEHSVAHMDTDDLLHRTGLLSASIQAGNEGKVSEGLLRNMLQELRDRQVISKEDYEAVFA